MVTAPSLVATRIGMPIRVAVMPLNGPLTVSGSNARYFVDAEGNPVYLAGAHTWNNMQDMGTSDPPPVFGYDAWLDFVQAAGHNCVRIWAWEQARWSTEVDNTNVWFSPNPYARSTTAGADDGKNKWDCTAFTQDYFDRLRSRVIAAGQHGLYCIVMLFNGWSVGNVMAGTYNPWDGHPYKASNNVNSVDGDTNDDGDGYETHQDSVAGVVTAQKALIAKFVDTLNDLDHVMWEIANEGGNEASNVTWQSDMAGYIQTYEAGKAKQHLIGVNMLQTQADSVTGKDWVSYNSVDIGMTNPSAYSGSYPNVMDSDHNGGIVYTWNPFRHLCRGHGGVLLMDEYDGTAVGGGASGTDERTDTDAEFVRHNLGYVLDYAARMPLLSCTPQAALSSSGYCLAYDHASAGHYLCFYTGVGTFTLNLSTASGTLNVEWLRCTTGATSTDTVAGGDTRTMTPPWTGDVVCYVYHG